MLRNVMIAILVLSGPSSPALAQAQSGPKVVLDRSGEWLINYDKNACHALAEFGQGADKVELRITKSGIDDQFVIALAGRYFAAKFMEYKISLDFGLADKPHLASGSAGMAGNMPVVIAPTRLDGWGGQITPEMTFAQAEPIRASAPKISRQQEAKVIRLMAILPDGQNMQFNVGSMLGPMTALRACMNSLMGSWGYDPQILNRLTRLPQPIEPGLWATTNDYPTVALRQNLEATVRFRLDVGEDGKTKSCTVESVLGASQLGGYSCKLLQKRAKFLPALDANGNPTKSFYSNSVRWMTPG